MPQTGNTPIAALTYFTKINECGITWHGLRLWGDTRDCNMNSKYSKNSNAQILKSPMSVLSAFPFTQICPHTCTLVWKSQHWYTNATNEVSSFSPRFQKQPFKKSSQWWVLNQLKGIFVSPLTQEKTWPVFFNAGSLTVRIKNCSFLPT